MRQKSNTVSPMSNEGRNLYVIEHITDAFRKLLQERPVEEISISELCSEAGVGRASFYRNFNRKEDVLKGYINRLLEQWKRECEEKENCPLSEMMGLLFAHFERYREFYSLVNERNLIYLLKEGIIDMGTLIIDAKSGTSGAGRGAKVPNLYCEVNENIKAYGVASHRHTPEIEEQLGYAARENVVLNFTPHLVPMNRGILVTEYASLKKEVTYEDVKAVYDKYYGNERFIRFLDEGVCPETKWVEGSNYVDINVKIDSRTNRIIMMGAIDNLVKGAAGQAVQNMNLMFGLPESEGLKLVPMFP